MSEMLYWTINRHPSITCVITINIYFFVNRIDITYLLSCIFFDNISSYKTVEIFSRISQHLRRRFFIPGFFLRMNLVIMSDYSDNVILSLFWFFFIIFSIITYSLNLGSELRSLFLMFFRIETNIGSESSELNDEQFQWLNIVSVKV